MCRYRLWMCCYRPLDGSIQTPGCAQYFGRNCWSYFKKRFLFKINPIGYTRGYESVLSENLLFSWTLSLNCAFCDIFQFWISSHIFIFNTKFLCISKSKINWASSINEKYKSFNKFIAENIKTRNLFSRVSFWRLYRQTLTLKFQNCLVLIQMFTSSPLWDHFLPAHHHWPILPN